MPRPAGARSVAGWVCTLSAEPTRRPSRRRGRAVAPGWASRRTRAARGGTGGGRRAVLLGIGAVLERLAELADAVSERAREVGQAFGAEHDQRDDGDEDQVWDSRCPWRWPLRDDARSGHCKASATAAAVGSGPCGTPALAAQRGRRRPGARTRRRPTARRSGRRSSRCCAAIVIQLLLPERLTAGPLARAVAGGSAAGRPVRRHAERRRGRAPAPAAHRARR